MMSVKSKHGPLAALAAASPALAERVQACLAALARLPSPEERRGHGRWQRARDEALAATRVYLRSRPAEARTLTRWLYEHDHAILEQPAVWAAAFPGAPMPRQLARIAFVDMTLGLPPIPDDDALLREWQARQARHGEQQIFGHPTPYPALRELVRHLALAPDETLCDLGAGHGRVVLYLALLGRQARGVELLPDRHAIAEAARRERGLTTARFDQGSVLDTRFWSGPDSIVGAGWHYLYDPFDHATHVALLERLRLAATHRPTRLLAYIQTSRYRERYQTWLADGWLRPHHSVAARLSFGLHVFDVAPAPNPAHR